ncbi:MAG: response regulator transcription factor [Actinomycetota bacterium]
MSTLVETRPVRVVLADDHPMLRRGLRMILESSDEVEVVAEADNGQELIDLVEDMDPDVVVVDVAMPKIDGLEAVRRIHDSHPNVKALIFTVHDEEAYVHRAVLAGASGYLLKTASADELIQGIITVSEGKAALHPSVTRHLLDGFTGMTEPKGRGAEPLSQREHDVLQLLAYGKTNKEIARDLGIGAQTVKTHISHIFTKMGAADRTDAVALALRKGLVQ